jgi:hypothetical protein
MLSACIVDVIIFVVAYFSVMFICILIALKEIFKTKK